MKALCLAQAILRKKKFNPIGAHQLEGKIESI